MSDMYRKAEIDVKLSLAEHLIRQCELDSETLETVRLTLASRLQELRYRFNKTDLDK